MVSARAKATARLDSGKTQNEGAGEGALVSNSLSAYKSPPLDSLDPPMPLESDDFDLLKSPD